MRGMCVPATVADRCCRRSIPRPSPGRPQKLVSLTSRFKKDFLAGGTLRDPAATCSDSCVGSGRSTTRTSVVVHESLNKMLVERIQGESGGLSRLDLDTVFAALIKTRQRLDHQIREFRDGLDQLKVAVGLSPRRRSHP